MGFFLNSYNKMQSKVSIILTVFNGESTIERAVRSLLNQTYSNFELIIVDDASTDYTLNILKGLQKQDERIRLITTSENYGTYVCKNYGMKISTGDYFMFCDADDQCTPLYVETAISFLTENPKVKVCYQNCFIDQSQLKNVLSEYTQKHWWGINSISSCFSREVFEEVGYFDSVRSGADSELMVRWMCVYGEKVVLLPEELSYRVIKLDGSLTCDEKIGIRSPSIIEYQNECHKFHQRVRDKKVEAYMDFPQINRPFKIDDTLSIGKKIDLSTFKEIKKGTFHSVPLTKWLQRNSMWKKLSDLSHPDKTPPINQNTTPTPNENLVFTCAGNNTKFDELWLGENRKYDVWVVYYEDDNEIYEKYKSKVDYIEKRKGAKFPNFHHIYKTKDLSQYKRFFIIDDDIIISTEDINKMFQVSLECDLGICQPSFDSKSKLGWGFNKHNPEYYLRYSNFVEVNTPLFTKETLDKFMEYYSPDLLMDWGVDFLYIWANGSQERKKYAVIDNIVCHNPYNEGEGDKISKKGTPINKRIEQWKKYSKKLNIASWKPQATRGVINKTQQIEHAKSNYSPFIDVKFDKTLKFEKNDKDKIAFLFLTRNNLKQPQLWYDFLSEGNGRCNMYAHTKERDKLNQQFLIDHQIPEHIHTEWGESNLVTAANILIKNALKDPTNKRFILVSESCIPLYFFDVIHHLLFKENSTKEKSFLYTKITPTNLKVSSHAKQKDAAYLQVSRNGDPSKELGITWENMMRNSQWMILNRFHAEIIDKHNYEHLWKNFNVADEWYHYNVLRYHDPNIEKNVITHIKPTWFGLNLTYLKSLSLEERKKLLKESRNNPDAHPSEFDNVKDIMSQRKEHPSFFLRKVSENVKIDYKDLYFTPPK